MKVYPTTYAYNAPKRGPKSFKELNKVVTGIKYDLKNIKNVGIEHSVAVDQNTYFTIHGQIEPTSDIKEIGNLNGFSYEYTGTEDVGCQLSYINKKLDNMLKNL